MHTDKKKPSAEAKKTKVKFKKLRIMKTRKDLKFTKGFLTENDKNAILQWINENENLFLASANYMIYTEVHFQHHNTMLYISVIGAGMLAIGKAVDKGYNYLYNEYCNFSVK